MPVRWPEKVTKLRAETPDRAERPAIHVLIVDGQSLFRDAVVRQLRAAQVRAEQASDLAAAQRDMERLSFDVILLEAPSEADRLLQVRALLAVSSCPPIVLLTQTEDLDATLFARRHRLGGVSARPLIGTSSCRRYGAPPTAISSHLAHVGRGLSDPLDVNAAFMRGALAALTGREREVLALLSQGVEGHVLADALGLSPNTVRTHVQNMLDKLQVHSRLEAIALLRASEVA